jgi:DNA-binding CsgD family transcriptional regulator
MTHGEVAPLSRHSSSRLSPRQVDVVRLAATGLAAKQIAVRLGISSHTVYEYLQVARQRVGVSTQAELIAWAVTSGNMLALT